MARSRRPSGSPEPSKAKTKRKKPRRRRKADEADPPKTEEAKTPPPKPPRVHLALVALGGVMQFLGFAGFSLWPFAFLCFVPMFYVIDQEPEATTGRVMRLGLLHGFVAVAGGYYWLVEMLKSFSGFAEPLCWAMASVFFLYRGGQQMLIFWIYARARRRGFRVTISAVATLLALEFAYPVLFPAYVATGFHDLAPMIQIADLGGPLLLSAVVMLVSGALYETVVAWRAGDALPRRTIAVAAAALVATLVYGFVRIAQVDARAAEAPTLDVGMVQVNMGIFAKHEDPLEGRRRHLAQSAALVREHPELDLMVWPESAYTFFVPEHVTNLRRRVQGELEVPILFGGLARRRGPDGQGGERMHAYNTAYLIDAAGDVLGTYDKTYLLMFGEYLPFGETFPILYEWSPNSGHFTPGDHVRPLVLPTEEHGEVRVSTLVCYEDVLPRFTRGAVREADPHLLANITNDAWFGDTHEPWIHLALAKFRAVEHHRALVRSTNSGVSAFVDPVGRVIETIGVEERGQAAARLPLLTGMSVYAYLGDWPGWLAVFGVIYMAFVRRRR